MTDVSKFDLIGPEKPENDAIGAIDPKAPYFVVFGVEFLAVERGMKRILSE